MIYNTTSKAWKTLTLNPFPDGQRVLVKGLKAPYMNGRIGLVQKGSETSPERISVSLVSEQTKQTYNVLYAGKPILNIKFIKPENLKPLLQATQKVGGDNFDDYPFQLPDGQFYLACLEEYLARHYENSAELQLSCSNARLTESPLILEIGSGNGVLNRHMKIAGNPYPMMLTEQNSVLAKELMECTTPPDIVVGNTVAGSNTLTCDIENLAATLTSIEETFKTPSKPAFLIMKDILDMFVISAGKLPQILGHLWDALPQQGRILNFNAKKFFIDTYRNFVKIHPDKIPILNNKTGKIHYFNYQKDILNAIFSEPCGKFFSTNKDLIDHLSSQSFDEIFRIHQKFVKTDLFSGLTEFESDKPPIDLSNKLEEGIKGLTETDIIDLGQGKQFKVICNQNKTHSFECMDTVGVNGNKGVFENNKINKINLTYHVLVLEKLQVTKKS